MSQKAQKAFVLTVSDGVSAGTREDESGAALAERLQQRGFEVETGVVADEMEEIALSITEAAQSCALIVTTGGTTLSRRDVIVAAAARHRLPAVYPHRSFTSAGGLISYGPDLLEPFRSAAVYVDRVLRGEKPADLPVQATTRYETVVNLRTAKALGLDVPPTLLATADEVIE